MKFCFTLQRRFAYIAHDLAILLKEKNPSLEFCGYVFQRSSYNYLKTQKDVTYTNLILDEDIHKQYKKECLDMDYLKRIECEYGIPFLWPYLSVDRILISNQLVREYPYNKSPYTLEEKLLILQVTAKNIIKFLDDEKPDCVIFSVIGTVGQLLLYQIAKKRNIKVYVVLPTCLKDKFILSESYDTFTDADVMYKNNFSQQKKNKFYEEAVEYLKIFRKQPMPYNLDATPQKQPLLRTQQLKFLMPKNLIVSLKWLVHLVWEYFSTDYKDDYSYISPWSYFKDRVKRKTRNLIGNNDLYDEFKPNENFVFYPLHYEPEISLLLQAPHATDQIHIIKQIARSLPIDYKLYVKEHPLMVIYRPRSYYKELKKIPNVVLLNPNIPSWNIIPNAKLITTITGSAGWEGLMLKKPVITFGNQTYNVLPMVKKCRDMEKLAFSIQEQLENYKYNEEELLYYIAAIIENAATLPLIQLWEKEIDELKKKNGLGPLADLIAQKVGL